jgi:serine/threonine-protein kinase
MTRRALVLACLLFSTPAAAADDAKLAAEALFAEGRQLMDAGKLEEACAKFEQSEKLDSAPGTLLNLGECHEKRGKTASAWAAFRRAAAAANAKGQTERGAFARDRAARLEPDLAKLSIVVPDEARVSGLVISRDGRSVDATLWGTAVPVDPGRASIEARAPGRQSFRRALDVAAGKSETLVLPVLAPRDTGTGPDTEATSSSGGSSRTLGIVLVGVGAVGLGVSTFFGFRARSKYQDSKQHCLSSDENQCEPQGIELRDEARTSGNVATISGLFGLAAVTAGAIVYLTAPSSEERSARRIWIAPEVDRRGGGLHVTTVW